MKSTLARLEDGTIQLTITIPWTKVDTAKKSLVDQTVEQAKVAGFRKGKAPKKLVEDTIDPQKVNEEALKKLLPEAYVEAVKEHDLKPIINPKLHVQKLDDGADWIVTATTAEMPEVKLGDYKDKVKSVTAKSKIVVPGKEAQEPNLDEIVKTLLETVNVTIPQILLEYEADRLLAQTLDEVKRLGLTLDQYLASTGRTPEALRKEYEAKARQDITLEFTLQKIAETESITVLEKEIEEAVQKAKDPQERSHLERNKYLLASIIRQQKTLDFLKNL